MTTMMMMNESLQMLKEVFGYDAFRPLQERVLQSVYEGNDTLVILPTGGGKSLCYQIPALVLRGVTFVISPLISLMKDQVDQLRELGVEATFLNSTISPDEMRQRMIDIHGLQYRLVYVAPERLDSELFLRLFRSLAEQKKVNLVAIDEAHCVSQWGHDFRPSYKRIGLLKQYASEHRFPFLALTATATERVKKDILTQLKLHQPQQFIGSFDRPNLHYAVHEPFEKRQAVLNYLKKKTDQSGIIYCGTRKHVEQVADYLKEQGLKVGKYHAGISDKKRQKVQEQFIKDKLPVIVATNAFGMGIDKPNVRFVLHYDMPGTMEHYVQEAGRAGRDGEPSECVLFFHGGDVVLQRFFIEGNNPPLSIFLDILRVLKKGPLSAKRLLREISSSNGMAMSTALNLLRESGSLVRQSQDFDAPFEWTGKALSISAEELEVKRKQAEIKLQRMLAYVETHECKRNDIQKYFGFSAVDCSSCSSCEEAEHPEVKAQQDVTDAAHLILRGIKSFPRAFGMALSAGILCGSKSQKVLQWKAEKWPAYGSMNGYPQSAVIELMKQLVRKGQLLRQGDEFPVLAVSPLGEKVLQENTQITVDSDRSEAFSSVHEDDSYDRRLFELLRNFRTEEAQRREIPPYMIFSDRVLKDLATFFPQTLEELEQIQGMGAKKIEQYGEALLQIVIPYCEQQGLSFIAPERTPKPVQKKPIRVTDTRKETLQLLQSGKNVAEIAQVRGLNPSTIESHIADLIQAGEIQDMSPFISHEQKQQILRAIDMIGSGALNPLKQALDESISYGQIKMVLAEKEKKNDQ